VTEWRVIADAPAYEVSDDGQVRQILTGRILRASISSPGYLAVHLGPQRARVHALVAGAFIGPRPARHETNHIDGDKLNNRVSNLEYVTPGTNQRHAYAMGLKHPRPADVRPRKKSGPRAPRTTCERGLHELTPENTYRKPSNPAVRACRACIRLYRISLHEKQRMEATA
jgi:hypothetical protein